MELPELVFRAIEPVFASQRAPSWKTQQGPIGIVILLVWKSPAAVREHTETVYSKWTLSCSQFHQRSKHIIYARYYHPGSVEILSVNKVSLRKRCKAPGLDLQLLAIFLKDSILIEDSVVNSSS